MENMKNSGITNYNRLEGKNNKNSLESSSLKEASFYVGVLNKNDNLKNLPGLALDKGKKDRGSKDSIEELNLDKKNDVICLLCPHFCRISEGERGLCRARGNINGKLYTFAYSNLCALCVDPIEKKPLFHFLLGSKTLSVAIAGCNLKCLNCQNYEISQTSPEKAAIITLTPFQLVKTAVDKGIKVISYTYTEPTIFFEYVYDTSVIAREKGIRNVIVSNGYINPKPLEKLCKVIDGANIDLKSFDEQKMRKLTSGELKPVLNALKVIKASNVFLEITNLIVPSYSDDLDDIEGMCKWIVRNLGEDTPIHFSAFYPTYKLSHFENTALDKLISAKKLALKSGLKFVYIGNTDISDAENTYCPNCKELLVKRQAFSVIKNNIREGRCTFCKNKIAGVWN